MNKKQIQQLRIETGAGIMDIKKALEEASGNMEKALEILRKKDSAIAAKKGLREAKEGLVTSYIHAGGKVGVLLKLYCETDFVARTGEFKQLAHDIALHIAAMNPEYISRADVPKEVINKEKEIYKEQFVDSGKSDDVVNKIIEGKLNKFMKEVSLLEQPFIKDQDKSIEALIEENIAKLGENIQIGEFVRYEL